jgi:hypothetical protein
MTAVSAQLAEAPPLRIENSTRTNQAANRSTQRTQAAGLFQLDDQSAPQQTASSAAPLAPSAIGALLALQSVDDPLLARRKAVRRGSALLDALAAAQADLLTGPVGEGRLNQMMALVTQARETVDPQIDALIDDIELRVRVELAKRGRYPA